MEGPSKGSCLLEWLRVGASPGYHTIQRRYGCDVLPGGYFSHGIHELTFNGHDYIALNEDLRTWTAAGKAADLLRREWEESGFANVVKTYVTDQCVESLLTQLDYGKEVLLRTGKDRNCPRLELLSPELEYELSLSSKGKDCLWVS